MKVTLIRHCESKYNKTQENTEKMINCGLTNIGFEQSKQITGFYNLIIISPLQRCLETFHNSKLKYDKYITNELFREHKVHLCDFLENEKIVYEKESDVLERISKSKKYLKSLKDKYEKIAIVTHADFIFYFTSRIYEGELYGQWLKNGESFCFEF